MPEALPSPSPGVVIPDHELLQPIGRGSYGEVWLARSALGEHRAVKLIRKDGCHDDRPFEREFEGLQKFEPISRSHEGFVHILHAGRFEGGFFYVMELADAAEPLRVESSSELRVERTSAIPPGYQLSTHDPLNYAPRTLRGELQRRGRLPVNECLELALKLTDALAHLHGHGLVHRDLKPSNIIFVSGQPKLADIGLVASADASMSCVGTEGYLPPEGPGKPPADLYALGKVLYELSTGRDRTDFPELPTLLRDDPQRQALEEFNEVILKACDPDVRRRYQTAAEMRDELELLHAGKSLQQVRRGERRWAGARKFALAAGVVLALVAGVRWLTPDAAPPGALASRTLAVERTWPMFDISPDGERIAFRRPAGLLIWERKTSTTRPLEIHGADGWLNPGVSGPFGIPRWAPDNRHLAFMPAKQIGGTEDGPTNAYATFLIDTHTGEARKLGPDLAEAERLLDWCWQPDGQGLTCVTKERKFFTLLLTGERIPWRGSNLPANNFVQVGGYSRDGKWLAVATDHELAKWQERDVWLVPHLGGQAVRLTDLPGFDAAPTWGPDGESVYFVSDDGSPRSPTRGIWKLRINLRNGNPRGPAQEVFTKKGQQLGRPKFVAEGKTLVYLVTGPDTRVWAADASDLSRTNSPTRGQDPVLSPDGGTIYFTGETPEQQGVFAIDRNGRALPRKLGDIVPLVGNFPRSFLQVSPDGSLLALPGFAGRQLGLFLVPTTNGPARLIESIPDHRVVSPVWSPDGQWLAYALGKELRRVSRDLKTREVLATLHDWDGWNVRWSPDGKHIAALGYGPPETRRQSDGNHVFAVSVADRRLRQLTPDSEGIYKEGLEWHPDSRRLTYFHYGPEKYSAKLKWAFLDRPGQPEEMLDQGGHWDYLGVWAPDGRHFHFTSSPDNNDHPNIHVFDADTKQVIHGLRNGNRPEWSRDGRTMVWAAGETKRYFEEIEDFPR